MITISFIIPVYNTGKEVLFRCLNSICKQGFKDYEIIIVDDGSDNKYLETFTDAEKLDDHIKVLHKKNGGPASARNFGIKHAKGYYSTFVDADDQISDCFFTALRAISCSDLPFVIGGNTDTENEDFGTLPDIKVVNGEYINEIICNMISEFIYFGNGYYFGRGAWARLVITEIAKEVIFDEALTVGEDICWNIDLLRRTGCVGLLELPIYKYTISENSVTRRFNTETIEQAAKGITAIEERIDTHNKRHKEALLKRCFEEIERIYRISFNTTNRKDQNVLSTKIYNDYIWKHLINDADFKPKSLKLIVKQIMYKTRTLFIYFELKYGHIRK